LVIAENPDLHRYVAVKGYNASALSDTTLYSFEISSQNSASPTISNFDFREIGPTKVQLV